jgi:3-hydroxybutyryl-CoA dehydrogenase
LLTIAIIGAGPLGRWLALAAARTGFRVLLEDVMPANLHHAQEYIRRQLGASVLDQDQARVAFVSTIEDAVREADLAVDCVPDELESKLEILWLLDRMAPPRTVLATPVAEARGLAEGPASQILVRTTHRTSAETVALVAEFWQRLGIRPSFETEPDLVQTPERTPDRHAAFDDRIPRH